MTVNYVKRLFLLLAILLPVYGIIRALAVWKCGGGKTNRKNFWAREVMMAFFFSFMAVLLFFTLVDGCDVSGAWFRRAATRIQSMENINLIPFRTILDCFYNMSFDDFLINFIGNMIMFVPWGFSLPFLWEKYRSLTKMGIYSLLLPVCIETVQLFVGRTVDVDDVILNFLGGFLGAWFYLKGKDIWHVLHKAGRD